MFEKKKLINKISFSAVIQSVICLYLHCVSKHIDIGDIP